MRRDWWVLGTPLTTLKNPLLGDACSAAGFWATKPKTELNAEIVKLFLAFSGRTTGGSHTAMSCHMGEAVEAIQGWGRRAGTPTSLPCTPSLEGTRCRAGGSLRWADRKASLLLGVCMVFRLLSLLLTCLSVRLGLLDPDLPPPGPPTLKSFKVSAAVSTVGVLRQPLMFFRPACTRLFQEFLLNTDDNMDETESVKRYNQYKLDFRRQQLQEFFLQHKEQEWFRSKFHPLDMAAKRAESLAALKTRLRVFLFLLDNSWLDSVLLDMEHAPSIIKLLDAGGSEGELAGVRGSWCLGCSDCCFLHSCDKDGGRN